MKRTFSAATIAVAIVSAVTIGIPAAAQPLDPHPSISEVQLNPEEQAPSHPAVTTTNNSEAGEEPFAAWGLATPPGAENYEVNQVSDEELDPRGVEGWQPTPDPQDEIVDGQMRSDIETVPEDFSDADADRAELAESALESDREISLQASPRCSVYWPSWFEVCGSIRAKYDSMGGPQSFLSLPKSYQLINPDGIGRRSEFVNGFIYWHPDTGAHSVSIPVSVVWQRHGWEGGFLGYPTTSDMALGDQWFKQSFQGGHVYTHNTLPASQASIQGAIYDKWQSLGAQNSELGFPISDELTASDGIGRYNVFEGGMIYWTPQHGAHAVTGGILAKWALQNFERSGYGYPIGDATTNEQEELTQDFEGGTIFADPNFFWQPFSCIDAISRIALENSVVDDFDFICSNRGISLTTSDTNFFGMPTVDDVVATTSFPQLRSTNRTPANIGVECDLREPSSISGPLRSGAYKVSKSVHLCCGQTEPPTPTKPLKVKWSRELAWTIANTLPQRQIGAVTLQVNSLDLPGFTFTVDSRLQEDKKFQIDPTMQRMVNTVSDPGANRSKVVNYDIPTRLGTYFVEVTGISLKIPDWNYNAELNGLRFAIGRYHCPQYRYYSDLCEFPDPVDDHT